MRALAGLCLLSLVACGPKSMSVRMKDAERRADQVNTSLDEAEKAETALEPKKAQSALDDAKKGLMDPDINLYPELDMMVDRYKELQSKLDAVKAAREKKDLDERLNKARDKVVPAALKMSEALDKLSPSAPTKDQIEAVEDHAKDVREGVDDAKDLFVKDPDFASWAKSQLSKADKAMEEVNRAKAKLRFIEGPGAAYAEGLKKAKEARAQKAPEDKLSKLNEAKEALQRCEKDGTALSAEPALSQASLKILPGKPQPPAALAKACKDAQKGIDAELDRVKKVLAKLAAKKAPKGKKK